VKILTKKTCISFIVQQKSLFFNVGHRSLRREDVDVITPNEIENIRKKRKILTEKELDAKMGVAVNVGDESQMRIEDILVTSPHKTAFLRHRFSVKMNYCLLLASLSL